MNEIEKMWTALSAHQPIADKKGYGVAWARMCRERTASTADTAADTAAIYDSANAYAAAARAADYAAATEFAKQAIAHITKANGEQA